MNSFSHFRKEIKKVFSFGKFEGFVGEFSKDIIDRIARNPLVEKITQDFAIQAFDKVIYQEDAPSHLVRLSQKAPVEEVTDTTYYYGEESQGQDVTVYIVDTGVFVEHPDFEGRATLGPNFSTDKSNIDYIGHGTHVAGIVGSKTYGVAKKVNIHSVKVLDRLGQGSLSSVIAGLEYAVKHSENIGNKGVVNLSLGAAKSAILDSAVKAAYDAGLLVVAAAGNNNRNACQTSPAGSTYTLTVGAIDDKSDTIASFSNFGSCVDIFASGVEVHSLNVDKDDNDEQVLSGTSMASPSVAGLAATMLEQGVPPERIKEEMLNIAIWNAIPHSDIKLKSSTHNTIVYNGFGRDVTRVTAS